MYEYELYTRILSPEYRAANQDTLTEEKLTPPHTTSIMARGVDSYSVYRFDAQEKEFLPFFNNTHDGDLRKAEYPAPTNLRAFCDYIILIEKSGKLFVFLIEMKSGGANRASEQLAAASMFMDFIKSSARRISKANGYDTFDESNIITRKFVLKKVPNFRPKTNVSSKKIDFKAEMIEWKENTFPLLKLCNLHNR